MERLYTMSDKYRMLEVIEHRNTGNRVDLPIPRLPISEMKTECIENYSSGLKYQHTVRLGCESVISSGARIDRVKKCHQQASELIVDVLYGEIRHDLIDLRAMLYAGGYPDLVTEKVEDMLEKMRCER
jgi:hypothetical protein